MQVPLWITLLQTLDCVTAALYPRRACSFNQPKRRGDIEKFIRRTLPQKWVHSHDLSSINKSIAKIKKQHGTGPGFSEAIQDYEYDYFFAKHSLKEIASDKLIRKAAKYRIPFPSAPFGNQDDEDGLWEFSQFTGGNHLTDKGYYELTRRIRAEKKARVEIFMLWIPLISALAALMGASAAVIALLKDIIFRHLGG